MRYHPSAPWRICVLLLVAMSTILIARLIFGPFALLLPVRSAANPEGWVGLAATGAILAASRRHSPAKSQESGKACPFPEVAACLILVTWLTFWRTIHFSFLSDDFIVVRYASQFPPALSSLFAAPGGDGFFRPIGNLSLAVTALWAGYNPVAWHAAAIAIHAANVVLVARLAHEFFSSRLTVSFAALLFAIHGTRPEAATWIAGRFDLAATFFLLCGLLFYIRSSRHLYRLASLLCMVLAILSKESAYVFPLLLLVLHAGRREFSRKVAKTMLVFFATAFLLFAYRIWLFKGLGGYRDPHYGTPQALAVGLSTVKTLALRIWMALYFPMNWSVSPGVLVAALTVLYVGALLTLATSRPERAKVVFGFGFLAVAILPPLHLLGIDDTLANSRLLYLPSAGFALMLAATVDQMNRRLSWIVCGVILLFHFAALQHNLDIWADTSTKAQAVRHVAFECGRPFHGDVALAGTLPGRLHGVPFFANGLAEIFEVRNRGAGAPIVTLHWNDKNETASCKLSSPGPSSAPPPCPLRAPDRPCRPPRTRARTGDPRSSRHAGTSAAPAPSG